MRRRQFLLTLMVGSLAVACRGAVTPTTAPGSVASPTSAPAPQPTAPPNAPTPVATPTPVQAPGQQMLVALYFLRGEQLGVVRRAIAQTPRVGTAALTELLKGPTPEEAAWGFRTAIPTGTELRGLAIDNGLATVNLSSAFASGGGTPARARVAQVVFTLTQFPTVQAVRFQIEGQPITVLGGTPLDPPPTRAAFEELLPLIFVEEPGPGEAVRSPLRVRGTANTFEATFMVRLSAENGAVLLEQPAMATSGSGTRGTFDLLLDFTVPAPTDGTLRLWELSAKDGSETNVVEIPLRLLP